MKRRDGEDRHASASAKPRWAQFFPIGHPLQNTCPLVTIVPPVCLLADTSNNPDIWPASKLITTLDGIDPSSGGFPSRAVCFCSLLLLSFFWLLLTLSLLLFFSPWPHALFFHSHLLWVIWCSHWYMQGVVTKPNVTQIKNYISGECPPSFPLFLLSLLMSR